MVAVTSEEEASVVSSTAVVAPETSKLPPGTIVDQIVMPFSAAN